jgi:predicted signal transduction protein with EAL and GGDEF domain
VAALEESLASLEHQAEANTDQKMIDAADALERGRDRLVQELLETLTAMGRAQGRLALAGAASRAGGDELALLAKELEESVVLRAEAAAEVEESLKAGTATA